MSALHDDPLLDLPLGRVGASGEDGPFLRSKGARGRRRARRGALHRLAVVVQAAGAIAVAVALLAVGYGRVMSAERLRVAKVDVRGQQFLSEGEVRELLGPAVGENILGLDIAKLKDRLLASPWVSDATVRRTLPDGLQVEIRERVPLALAELERLYLMDASGTLIDIYGPRTAGFDLPIVRGLAGTTGEARGARAERAGALLADLGDLGSEVSEVEVEDSGDLRVVLRGQGEVLRLGAPPYRERLAAFLELRREIVARAPRALYFDLRFRDRIYAKQQPTPEPTPLPTPRVAIVRPVPRPPAPAPTPADTPAPTVPDAAALPSADLEPPAPTPTPSGTRPEGD
ncbi:MAG: FtsQ-type POTRA domain-containing protein [Vicinamibacteria bacterium]|nr:FtsQ-type POTRA domain-containing protein [Vicinamibacteria bacterium]